MKDTSQAISMETRLVPNPDIVFREEDDDCGLLFDPESGSVRVLNLTAASIWKSLDGQRTLSEIMEGLKEEFEDMDSNAEDQALRLIQELHRIGVVGTLAEVPK